MKMSLPYSDRTNIPAPLTSVDTLPHYGPLQPALQPMLQHSNNPGASFAALVVLLAAVSLVAGCGSLPQARMALPDSMQTTTPYVIDGVGGKSTGQISIADSSGKFSRSATRLSFFDLAVRDRASTRFEVSGKGWQGTLSADCGLREVRVEGSFLSIPVLPLKYVCDFNAGNDAQGRLVLAQAMGSVTQPTPRREGEVAYLGTVLRIRAEYGLAGSPFKLGRPSGYRFERDGVTVAAVELTDTTRPTLLMTSALNERERQTAILGALALGLLWEPDQ